ncbi:MAG: hypothetical protein ACTSUS_05075 [Candidatus Freyarchaeota archaeon]
MKVVDVALSEGELNVVLNAIYEDAGSEFIVDSPEGTTLLQFSYDDPAHASPCTRNRYIDREVPYAKYVDALAAGGCLPPSNMEEVVEKLERAAGEDVFTRPKPVYVALDTNLFYLRFPTHYLSSLPAGLRLAVPEPVRREILGKAGRGAAGAQLPLDVRLAKQALAEYEYVEKRLGAHLIGGEGVGDRAITRAIGSFARSADVVLVTADDNMRITAVEDGVPTVFVEQQPRPVRVELTYRNIPTTLSSLAVTYSRVRLVTVNPPTVTWVHGAWRGKRNEDWLSRTLMVQASGRIAEKVCRELEAVRRP